MFNVHVKGRKVFGVIATDGKMQERKRLRWQELRGESLWNNTVAVEKLLDHL